MAEGGTEEMTVPIQPQVKEEYREDSYNSRRVDRDKERDHKRDRDREQKKSRRERVT